MASRTKVTRIKRVNRHKNMGIKRKSKNKNKGTTPSLDKILGPLPKEQKN